MGLSIGIGIGITLGRGGRGYSIVNSELSTYSSGLITALSDEQLQKLDTFITTIKTGYSISNLADFFDTLYIIAGSTLESSLKNIAKNAHHLTAYNSPTWTQYEGIAGNGSNSYCGSDYDPSANGLRYTLNDASFGHYIRTCPQYATGSYYNGIQGTNGRNFGSNPYRTPTTSRFVINSLTASYANFNAGAAPVGMSNYVRTASNAIQAYHNKGSKALTDATIASVGLPTGITLTIGRNSSSYGTHQYSLYYTAKSMNQSQVDILTDAFESYMDSNGKGVIT